MTDQPGFFPLATRQLGLPPDTITVRGSEVQLFLTAAGDGKLQPELALYTHELGWYRIVLEPDVFKALLAQAVFLSNMTPEHTREIADELHRETTTETPEGN
jgi:hypothetical protein